MPIATVPDPDPIPNTIPFGLTFFRVNSIFATVPDPDPHRAATVPAPDPRRTATVPDPDRYSNFKKKIQNPYFFPSKYPAILFSSY